MLTALLDFVAQLFISVLSALTRLLHEVYHEVFLPLIREFGLSAGFELVRRVGLRFVEMAK
jgi:hypothetical protein